MNKKQIIAHLEGTIDVCEFLIDELGYIPEGSSVDELIKESKQIIKDIQHD